MALSGAPDPAQESPGDGLAALDPLHDVTLVYRPMWDVKRNAVTTFVCAPARPGPAGRLKVGESQIKGLAAHDVQQQLDVMMRKQVIADMRKLAAAKQKMLLCLPVHFESVASNARRADYAKECRAGLSPQLLQLIVFELTGVPIGVQPSRLLEISWDLRKLGRGVLMRTVIAQTTFLPAADTGITGVGFEHFAEGVPESRQVQELERFAVAAKKAGYVAYAHGLPSLSLTTYAMGAGFDFVDGDIVTSVVDLPRTAYSFDLTNLFAARK